MAVGLPAFAYVPGQGPRHAEDAFDAVRQVSDPLADSPAWKAGLHYFAAGYYWEAHEVWEAVWLAAPANSAEKCVVQGMIQLANAALKRRMGRPKAALRLDSLAQGLLTEGIGRGGASVMRLGLAEIDRAICISKVVERAL